MASGESVWGESESFAANSDLDKKVKVKKNLKQSPLNKPPKMLKQKRKQMNDEAVQIRKYMKFLGVLIIILIILGASIGYFYFNLFNSNSDHSDKVLNDSDGDGLEDSWELEHNLDPKNSDTDYDGMPDGWEVDYSLNPLFNDSGEDQDQDGYDMDNNGQIDYKERFTNLEEFLWKTNPREKDSDGDVMWDGWEVLFWERIEQYKHKNWLSDQPSRLDPTDPADANDDLDFVAKTSEGNIIGYILKPDKLLNREEFLNGTDPTKPDTDEDDLTDYQEVLKYNTDPLDIDSDHDNLWDGWEIRYGGWGVGLDPNDKDSDNDGILDSLEDLDNDTLWNLQELFMGTSPVSKDTDSDSLPDNWESEYWITEYIFSANPKIPDSEIDYDKDGLTNELEYIWNTSPSDIDTDDDGLEDGVEVLIYGTNPINNDTDTDGIKDKEEVLEGSDGYITNATNSDTDGDGISDLEEIINGLDKFITNPTKKDSDNDWLTDKEEIDAYWGWGKNRGYKTIPTVNDSDGDGLLDGEEVKTDFHPFIDFDTTIYNCIDTGPIDGTNATNPDTDGDGIPDGWEARFGNISRHGYIRYIKDFDLNYGYQRYGFNYLDKLNENPQVLFIWLVNPVDHRDKFDNIDSDGYDEDGDGELDNDEEYNNFEEWHNWESNPINDDSDSDGLSDGWEDYFGSEAKRDGIDGPNPVDKNDRDKDSDNDGIYYYVNNVKYSDLFTNYEEFVLGTNPIEKDTDGDGDGDYEEIWYGDNDRDGLLNGWEKLFNGSSNNKNDYVPKYPEFGHGGFYPDKADSDLDGIPDGAEDYDQDGRNNTYEQYIYGDVRVREIKEGPGTSDPTDPKMTPEDVRAKARAVHLTRSAEYYGENEKNLSSELKLNLIYVLKLIFNEKTIQQVLQLLSVFVIDNIQRWQFYLPTIIFY